MIYRAVPVGKIRGFINEMNAECKSRAVNIMTRKISDEYSESQRAEDLRLIKYTVGFFNDCLSLLNAAINHAPAHMGVPEQLAPHAEIAFALREDGMMRCVLFDSARDLGEVCGAYSADEIPSLGHLARVFAEREERERSAGKGLEGAYCRHRSEFQRALCNALEDARGGARGVAEVVIDGDAVQKFTVALENESIKYSVTPCFEALFGLKS